MRRTKPFDQVMMLVFVFGLIGSWIGGLFGGDGSVIGALTGCAIAGGIGVLAWEKRHRHDWLCGAIYDDKGKPRFMVKFCECGDIRFDGLVSREEGKGKVGEWIPVPLKLVKESATHG